MTAPNAQNGSVTPYKPIFRARARSVRRLLLIYIFSSIFVLLVIFSITVTWLTQSRASKLITENANEVAHALAGQSTLALLTESPENAESALAQVLLFPDVAGAGLVNVDGELIAWQGEEGGRDFFTQRNWLKINANTRVLFDNEPNYWHIAHLVTIGGTDDEAELETDLLEITEQRLGFAVVTFSKQNLSQFNRDLFIIISITGFLAIIGLPLIIRSVIRRLFRPLDELIHVMTYNQDRREHRSAVIQGAREFQQLSLSFNAMISTLENQEEELRSHRDQLEAEVNIRTKELVVARDAAMTSNRYKSEFLANVTHELRSPIQSIIGYVELVKEEAENEGLVDIQSDLEKVTRNAERLFALINSVLDLSKIEAGRMDLKHESVSIFHLIEDLVDATAPLVPRHNNTFSKTFLCEDVNVVIDKEKVLQILINLVSNACKFTQNGEIKLTVDMSGTSAGKKLIFTVSDTGIGIAADKLDIIFNQFQQLDGSESRSEGGTGLGLAISQQFCSLMKGELTVQSTTGKGSCFTLTIPYNDEKALIGDLSAYGQSLDIGQH